MQDFIIIQDDFFFGKFDTGDSNIFLNCRGNPVYNVDLTTFNEVVFGKEECGRVTPQMLRSYNTTFISHHPDPAVRDARAIATGNTDAVFMHHYNTEFLNYVVEVTKELRLHHNVDTRVKKPIDGKMVRNMIKDEEDEEDEVRRMMGIASCKIDRTDSNKPTDKTDKYLFKSILSELDEDLWSRAGTQRAADKKELGLTKMEWTYEVRSQIFVGT